MLDFQMRDSADAVQITSENQSIVDCIENYGSDAGETSMPAVKPIFATNLSPAREERSPLRCRNPKNARLLSHFRRKAMRMADFTLIPTQAAPSAKHPAREMPVISTLAMKPMQQQRSLATPIPQGIRSTEPIQVTKPKAAASPSISALPLPSFLKLSSFTGCVAAG